jgi:type I restriction enzyme S subunit
MEVIPGSKLTELGVFPRDWEIDSLSRFWSVTDCKHVTAKFTANGYPVASIMEVQSRFLDLTKANQTTQQFYNLLTEGGRKPRAGDLILSRNATVGEVAQVAEWHPPFAMGQDVCLLRKKSPTLSTNYLQAVFRSPIISNQLSDLMVGSTFKRVNVEQIRKLIVPMSPPAEQEAIAEALSDADTLIECMEQVLAKKRHIKQGAMQELLTGKKRLPGCSDEWERRPLAYAIEELEAGVSVNSVEEDAGLFAHDECILKTSAVLHGRFLPHEAKKIAPQDVARARLNPRRDTIVISRMNTPDLVGECGYVVNDYPHLFLPDRLWITRVRAGIGTNVRWLAYLLGTDEYKRQIKAAATGTSGSMKNISKAALLSLRLRFPQPGEQVAISGVLSDIDAEIVALEARLAKVQQLKQGVAQQLLTGKTRLV